MSICQIKNLSVKINSQKTLLDNISYNINPGDFVVILGSNGSGKTTLLKTINGANNNYSGSITINDIELKTLNSKERANLIGIITQNVGDSLFTQFSLMQNFQLYMDAFHNHEYKLDDFLSLLGSINTKLPHNMHSNFSALSGGEMQCFLLALNLFFKKKLLLLDEHTSALDPKTAAEVMKITSHHIQEKHVTCIMTTHSLDDAIQYGNRLIAMQNGKLIKEFNSIEKQSLSKQDLLAFCY